MGSCYSGDHIAGDHTHSAITTCTIEEAKQKYRLGTTSKRLLWGLKYVSLDPNPCTLLLQWFVTFGVHEGFLTHQ